ncbi:ABC transporter ATP-binding protein [Kitasatospora aureofaciens]|uniref:ABC transporter ATP-binding protein n=1 Tax=Kitasatospora aureofaciens TaxID=1894 RepID=UPI0036F4AB7D
MTLTTHHPTTHGHPAPADGNGLQLTGLTVGYHRRTRLRHQPIPVLAELNATARPGELTMLLGPNGTGKSTLLRTLCGLQTALAGRITVGGRDVARTRGPELARTLAAVLTDRIDPGMLTVRELVALGRHPHTGPTGHLAPHDQDAVARALRNVGAEDLAGRRVTELSDGQSQRVLVARALAQGAAVVVLDEPTAFLDVPSRVALTVLLRDLARRGGRTVLASTHDLELALRVADQLWLVDRAGRLHTGTPEDLVHAGLIAQVFDTPLAAFDPAAGVFTLHHAMRGTAHLTALPALRPLLERALAREGYTTTADTDRADITVRADGTDTGPSHYLLSWPGRKASAHSDVADLLCALREAPAQATTRQAP